MIEFYPEIRLAHIWAVIASGAFFLVRGVALFAPVPAVRPVRYLSYTADTILLTAALMLLTSIQLDPFSEPWLTVKLLLLPVYMGLGVVAFSFARRPAAQRGCWAAGLVVFAYIVTVARARDPLGVFSGYAF